MPPRMQQAQTQTQQARSPRKALTAAPLNQRP
jgi:hypothetical protein